MFPARDGKDGGGLSGASKREKVGRREKRVVGTLCFKDALELREFALGARRAFRLRNAQCWKVIDVKTAMRRCSQTELSDAESESKDSGCRSAWYVHRRRERLDESVGEE